MERTALDGLYGHKAIGPRVQEERRGLLPPPREGVDYIAVVSIADAKVLYAGQSIRKAARVLEPGTCWAFSHLRTFAVTEAIRQSGMFFIYGKEKKSNGDENTGHV